MVLGGNLLKSVIADKLPGKAFCASFQSEIIGATNFGLILGNCIFN